MFSRHLQLFAVWLAFTVITAAGEVPPGRVPSVTDESTPAPGRAERRQIAASLAAQLGNPRFEVREAATKKLEQLGIEAIEPLVIAAGGDNLECTCRALRALRSIFETGDDVTFDAAEVALEQLAESSHRSAAQRASAILSPPEHIPTTESEQLRLRRWRRAIMRIRDLGGIVQATDLNGVEKEPTEIARDDELFYLTITLEKGEKGWQGGATGLLNIQRMAVRAPLPTVYITDNVGIPADAIDHLQRAVPGLRIESRGQAMLGVIFDFSANCRVKGVKPYSAADKAGVKAGDVILKYDGESLSSFERLVEITKSRKPGDSVTLEVQRGDTKLNIVAQLTGWAVKKPDDDKNDNK